MSPILSFLILGGFCACALTNARAGMALTVAMAFLQDPLRKLTPEEPQYFILFAAIVFASTTLKLLSRGGGVTPLSIPIWNRNLGLLTILFVAILLLQAANSFLRFGNPFVPALGFANYMAPLVAIAATYWYALGAGIAGLRRLYRIYLILALATLPTVGLEALDVDWDILGEVGPGVWITTHGGLNALSGTFRASEIAAWHVSTASAVAIILLTANRPVLSSAVLALLLVGVMVGFGVLTGRRKFIIVIAIFVIAYLLFQMLFVQRARVTNLVIAGAVGVGLALLFLAGTIEPSQGFIGFDDYSRYVARTKSVFGDIGERAEKLGLMPVFWAYNSFGLLGVGLGIGTQGATAFLDVASINGAAEGGLGKLMLELGAPGLVVAILLAIGAVRLIIKILRVSSMASPRVGRHAAGFAAIVIAQGASFSVATQAFGDFFVLIFIGIAFGALLACPALAQRALRTRDARQPTRHVAVRINAAGTARPSISPASRLASSRDTGSC